MMSDSIKDFESAIAELEKIVKQLEDGDLRSTSRSRCSSAASSCRATATTSSARPSAASSS